jgi:hypothetical protein
MMVLKSSEGGGNDLCSLLQPDFIDREYTLRERLDDRNID